MVIYLQKVIINPVYGGIESGVVSGNIIEKDFNLEISKKIYDNLKKLGVDVYLVRDDDRTLSDEERLQIVNSFLDNNDEVIILSNMLASGNDTGAEIIYALRNDDDLAREISNYIESAGQDILKYYQLRNPSDTALDYYSIIRDVPSFVESIIVSYGYPSNSYDNSFLINNIDALAKATSDAIYDYLKRINIYVVQPGDSLYRIAEKFNTTVDEIKELNGLTSNNLDVGDELLIPKPKSPSNDNNTGNNFFNYTVEFGDTLYSIAREYNTTVNVLKEINNLTSNILQVGQVLKIPTRITNEDTSNYIIYTVKSGDSLYKIASTYGVTVDEIKYLNGLSSNLISIGQVLKIPSTTNNNQTNYLTYIVKSGDSLYKIAALYSTSVDEIKTLNNLTSNNLSIGQVLKIPTTTSNYISYTVKSGDSLYKIANSYNTTVSKIKELNNLQSDNLAIGQVLKIPV